MPHGSSAEADTWGEQLLDLGRAATAEVFLVCPFIKFGAFDRLIGALDETVGLDVVTRWRPEEIAQGVSDLEVWDSIRERAASRLWLHPILHAKYYRFDRAVVLGSANLTAKGLGWTANPNLELLVAHQRLPDFEQNLLQQCTAATDEIADRMREAADAVAVHLPPPPTVDEGVPTSRGEDSWLPRTRRPEDLFLAYSERHDGLSQPIQEAAKADLSALGVPAGLSKEDFEHYVQAVLLSRPIVIEISELASDEFVRFGEITDLLATRRSMDRDEAATTWQTLMRWLLYFAGNTFERSRPGHSELIRWRPKNS